MKKYRITWERQIITDYDIHFESDYVVIKANSKAEAKKLFREQYGYPIVLIEEGK